MCDYNLAGPSTGIDDVANSLVLRHDLYQCLNRHAFLFYPASQGNVMACFVGRDEPEDAELLHRQLVKMPYRVSDQSLYARFAYKIINLSRDKDAFEPLPINGEVRRRREVRLSLERVRKAGKQEEVSETSRS